MKHRKDMYINYDKYYRKRKRGGRKLTVIISILLLLIVLGCGVVYLIKGRITGDIPLPKNNLGQEASKAPSADNNSEDDSTNSNDNQQLGGAGITPTQAPTASPTPTPSPTPTVAPEEAKDQNTDNRIPVKVKGIYVTAPVAGSYLLDGLVKLTEEKEINAMVIDIKDDHGKITYRMNSPKAMELGATSNVIPNLETLVQSLKEKNIYLIARIVAFKDPFLAEQRKDLAIKNPDGTLFRDNNGEGWVNPYKQEVWDYLVEVASEAAAVGFDEIQFDYIRFSTGKGMANVDFGKEAETKSKEDIIIEFTQYAYDKLKPLGVFVSADVYGTIISSSVDAGLVGQNYVEMAKHLDYICPMIYPSHFGEGNYGIKYPDQEPYNIISKVMKASKAKLDQLPEGEHRAIVRPWLQDFTATWIKHYIQYGGTELREQIKGVYDSGYDEWLLWNAACVYSEEGLLPDSDNLSE